MKNIYQHNIELKSIRINNADKVAISQNLIDLPYRGYEVEELSDGRKIVITKPGGKSIYGRPKKEDFLVFFYNPNDNTLNFASGETPEALIKAYKWIWGQEDVNYPTGEGRLMSWKEYQEIIANL